MTADLTLDVLGRRCPIPVIELARHIEDVEVGQVVAVVADDEAARVDIPVWCRMKGHEFVGTEPAETGARYLVKRLR
ncbi:MAG TPA: sulfurtransferase TusA family protein [Frankiaceae bacterium]|nr:sulfurtransferase TusA family protein [Frankiaceae bacterium]